MSHPPNDPRAPHLIRWRIATDEEISFDEVRRAVFGERLRHDHSTILKDPLTSRMTELLKALEENEQNVSEPEQRSDHN